MCGIAGEIRFDGSRPDLGALGLVLEQMRSRGPDGEGVFTRNGVAFGHRRLKIIDLSEKSAQPMFDPELGLACVYNGAIYNYKELRCELEGMGYRFFSSGDTEVILKAYHAFGPRFPEKLRGMFAFAVWEEASGRVVFGRDRLGIKPHLYARIERGAALCLDLAGPLAVSRRLPRTRPCGPASVYELPCSRTGSPHDIEVDQKTSSCHGARCREIRRELRVLLLAAEL